MFDETDEISDCRIQCKYNAEQSSVFITLQGCGPLKQRSVYIVQTTRWIETDPFLLSVCEIR